MMQVAGIPGKGTTLFSVYNCSSRKLESDNDNKVFHERLWNYVFSVVARYSQLILMNVLRSVLAAGTSVTNN
jgi:hypothetical protein